MSLRAEERGRVRVVLIVIAAIAVAVASFVTFTTVSSYGKGPSVPERERITQWDGGSRFKISPSDEPTLSSRRGAITVRLMSTRKKRNKLDHLEYRHRFVTGTTTKKSTTTCTSAKAIEDVRGENPFGQTLVDGHLAISFGFEGPNYDGTKADVCGKVQVNTWGGAAGWSLWDYQGVYSMVRGHGEHCGAPGYCWEYYYRRAYFKWERGFATLGLTQHETTWASVTVRGDGTHVGDHYTG